MVFSVALPQIVVSFTVVVIAVELVNWAWVYRTANWKRVIADLERSSKELDVVKGSGTAVPTKKKAEKRLEHQLALSSRELYFLKMRTMATQGLLLVGLYTLLGRQFNGEVVAKLPFEPFNFLSSIIHRGLKTDDKPLADTTGCAVAFVYALCAAGLRPGIQKLLGFAPSRVLNRHTGMEEWMQKAMKQS